MGKLAHIVGEAWIGLETNRCPSDDESTVRVQAWGEPLDGTRTCALEALTIHSVRKFS